MATINPYFDQLLKNLQPPDHRLEAAQDLPPLIRDYLKACTNFPTIEPHTRLAGSYAQNMSAGDVKDVDVLVRLDGCPKENEPKAKQVIQDLKKALDQLVREPDALDKWQVERVEADLEIERARRSVHVYFVNQDFHLDIVPCIAPNDFDKPLYVPDRGYNKWVESHPLGYVALLNELNNKYDKKVKPLGKLLKHFRNYHMVYRKPKSYWLGAMLVDHIRNGNLTMSDPLPVLFHDLLDCIYKQFAATLSRENAVPHIKDPMLGHDVSPNWERSHFETFMRRVDGGRKWAIVALEDWESGNSEKAIEGWQKIFGAEYFPSNCDALVESMVANGKPGASYVNSQGLITATKPASMVSTLIKPTKFYGQE